MKVSVINGPNINMVGIRETSIYGEMNYHDIVDMIHNYANEKKIMVDIFQSNHEGAIVDKIQQAYFDKVDYIIINPGAYTHTSIAILDALKAVKPIEAIEVHFSDINSREAFRRVSYPAMACEMQIMGHGPQGYIMAIDECIKKEMPR